jgi:hypothetical protein
MQFLLLFSLTSFLSLFQFDGWRGDIETPNAKQEALCLGVSVSVKVFLEGPFVSGTTPSMTAILRTKTPGVVQPIPTGNTVADPTIIPTVEPYGSLSGYDHIDGNINAKVPDPASVFGVMGNNAIVDWVFLEAWRDRHDATPTEPADPALPLIIKVSTRSALLQADGDVVDIDGASPVTFGNTTNCNTKYYIVVRHKCHLGIRTLNTLTLGTSPTIIDFTTPAALPIGTTTVNAIFGTNAIKTIPNGGGTAVNAYALYAGDASRDGLISATDRNLHWVLQPGRIIGVTVNPSSGSPFTYLQTTADFNLDGAVTATDRNLYWRINSGKAQQLQ